MELNATNRPAGKKAALKQLRREGQVPAVLYSKGEKGAEITIDGREFKKILNTVPTGTLSSKVFTLHIEGKKVQAILKDIQYNIVTYDVIHLDFEELHADVPVNLNIPILCINVADCVGVKQGGNLRQVVDRIRVTCLPKDIPTQFEVDVRDLHMGQGKKLSTLKIPSGVRPKGSLNEMAVVVARR